MKIWMHASNDTIKNEYVIIVFDIVDGNLAENSENSKIAAARRSSHKEQSRQNIRNIIKNNIDRFKNDFTQVIENEGFTVKGAPSTSSRNNTSISCYFYATMNSDFDYNFDRIDLATIFCTRTSDHSLSLPELQNAVQNQWILDHYADISHPTVVVIRIIVETAVSYDDYFRKCKNSFHEICQHYRDFGEWLGDELTL